MDKTSPFPGKFRSDTSPWTKRLMEKYSDPEIRYVAARCPAQTSKTQSAIICVCYSVDEEYGPIMWVMAAADEAKTFSKTRLTPTLESIGSIKQMMPTSRSDKMICEINFAHAPIVINGANSPSKLQSKPIRRLVCDECRNYPPGALSMVLKRIRSWWNGSAFMVSTGDETGSEFDLEWKKGTQSVFCVRKKCCSNLDEMDFKNLKWDENEVTRPDGEWKMDEVEKTITYHCPHCGATHKDVYADRRAAAIAGDYIDKNPNAPKNRWSGTWSALIVPWVSWVSIVEEFLSAKKALDMGVVDPLRTFITETLGLTWDEQETSSDEFIDPTEYDPKEVWADEFCRFMTVDVQRDHFWFVIRSWSENGESRLLAEGMLRLKEDVVEMARTWDLHPENVVLDAGYDTQTNYVFQICAENGYTAFRGDDRKMFKHSESGSIVYRPYSMQVRWDPGQGRSNAGMVTVPLYYWSNPTIKDVTQRLKTGKGAKWEIHPKASVEYRNQMCSEAKQRHKTKSGKTVVKWERIKSRANHLWDCENMNTTCAFQMGLIINPFGDPKPEDEQEQKASKE